MQFVGSNVVGHTGNTKICRRDRRLRKMRGRRPKHDVDCFWLVERASVAGATDSRFHLMETAVPFHHEEQGADRVDRSMQAAVTDEDGVRLARIVTANVLTIRSSEVRDKRQRFSTPRLELRNIFNDLQVAKVGLQEPRALFGAQHKVFTAIHISDSG